MQGSDAPDSQPTTAFRECLSFAVRNAIGPEAGIFGPRSLSWAVYREMALLSGGGRALLLQLAHPAVAEGVYQHSNFRKDPLGRAWRTSRAMNQIVFGDLRSAVKAAKRTQAIHARVRGVIRPETSSRLTGQRYRATDPQLRLWVYATLFDSALLAFERLISPLSEAQKERLYREGKLLAALNGIPPGVLPASYADFRVYFEQILAGPTLEVGETAKILCAPLFRSPWEVLRVDTILTAGFLPSRVRDAFGLRWTKRRQQFFATAIRLMRATIVQLPPALRYAPAYHLAQARIAQSRGKRPSRLGRLMQRLAQAVDLPFA